MTRVLIVGANAPPEPVGIGKYTGELAEWLAARGHTVELICAPPAYPHWRIDPGHRGWRYARKTCRGVRLWRCPLYVPRRPGGLGRLLQGLSFGLSCFPVALWRATWQRPGVVLCVVPTLFAAPAALVAARLTGAAAWLHVQDLEIDAAFSLGLLRGRGLGAVAGALEGWLLRRFDRVTTISKAMQGQLVRKGVAPERIALLRNWVDTQAIRPQPRTAALRREFGLPATGTVALYAGSFGCKHGLDALVERYEIDGTPLLEKYPALDYILG